MYACMFTYAYCVRVSVNNKNSNHECYIYRGSKEIIVFITAAAAAATTAIATIPPEMCLYLAFRLNPIYV